MLTRTTLIALLAALIAAILPAAATAASVAPSLAITQGNGGTAGSSTPTVLEVSFANKNTAPKKMAVTFPPGFLLNLDQNEGKCLAESAPSPACSLGYVQYTAGDGEQTTADLYLVTAPGVGDAAGIVLSNGSATSLGTATVQLLQSPAVELEVEFPPFPTKNAEEADNGGIVAAEIKLTSPRLPSACGAPLFFGVTATALTGTSTSASTPLEVSGCSTLPYAPTIAATVTRISGEEGADLAVTISQPNPAGESATNSFEFGNPKGVKTNKVLAPCFKGSTCTVGTIVGSSPTLTASELSNGELTLAGAINSGDLSASITGAVTMSFAPPFQFSVKGPINVNEHTITFLDLPDFPLNSLTYTFLGVPAGPAFVSSCEPSTISGTFTPQDGGPSVKATGPVTNVDCPPPSKNPTASGSVSGLNAGKPKLQIHAHQGPDPARLATLSLVLAPGLHFSGKTLTTKTVCKGSGSHRKCKVHGLSLSGASIKSARLEGEKLVITFASPAAGVSLTAHAPLLRESSHLEHEAKKHEAGTLMTDVGLTDANGKRTELSVG